MARILLGTLGSHGDVDPFIGLGVALAARGHTVTLATSPYYREAVTGAGIRFAPVGPDLSPADPALVARVMHPFRSAEFVIKELVAPWIPHFAADCAPLVRQADLVVTHPLTMTLPLLAQHHGIPWASTMLSPVTFLSPTDLPAVPMAPWLPRLARAAPWVAPAIVASGKWLSRRWLAPVDRLREELGLPDRGNPLFDGGHSPTLVLALYSRALGEPQPDWPPHTVLTGAIGHDAPFGAALPAELAAFLDDGAPPVLFTLGSSAVIAPGRFWGASIAAARRLGVRAVLLAGPLASTLADAGLPRGMLAVERAPHSLLMPRCAAVAHQCGVGTLMQGLRAALPALAVPYANDQPDNAHRLARLGVARVIPAWRYRARGAAAALDALLHDPAYRDNAARAAAVVGAERGAEAACDALERVFALA
ncbi:MAG: glycosyltransferase [Gemmatimonadetes bacterium]|nr:glycosyltransferase [Gemmatimonadota bacterium]